MLLISGGGVGRRRCEVSTICARRWERRSTPSFSRARRVRSERKSRKSTWDEASWSDPTAPSSSAGQSGGPGGKDLNDSVVVTSRGHPTYVAKDLGNFLKKNEMFPSWDTSLVVTGSEQAGHFAVVDRIIRDLFPDKGRQEHVATGFLTLKRKGAASGERMSSRKGNVLTAEDLLQTVGRAARDRMSDREIANREEVSRQVAVGAIKYQILRQRAGRNIVFEQEQALSFEGSSGPYLQYTNARIRSALRKAKEAGVTAADKHVPDRPYPVERTLHRFGEHIRAARQQRSPHVVVEYLTDLAAQFNAFYATERIADANDTHALYKAMVAEAVGNTLERGLFTLGIAVPEEV